MNPSPDDSPQPASGSAESSPSPTGTIRNMQIPSMPAVREADSETSTPLVGPSDGAGMKGTAGQQRELGIGRPGGAAELVGVGPSSC